MQEGRNGKWSLQFVPVLNTQDRPEMKPGKDMLLCPVKSFHCTRGVGDLILQF